jgi:hypothetical protein
MHAAAAALVFTLVAAASTEAGEGLDLVVVIDRSTSMNGERHAGTLLPRMAVDLLARNAAANRVEHRLAVISFGSSATIDVPFTLVRADGLPRLRRPVAELPRHGGGSTDVLAALVTARGLFEPLPANSARRRAIVLFTDGVPYVRGVDMNAYRADLQRYVTADLVQAGIVLHVLLAQPDESAHDASLWRAVTREVHPGGRTADRLLAEGHGAIARLAGTQTAAGATSKSAAADEVLVVPPYLETVVFDIFRASPDATVDVFPPGSSTPIRGGAGGVESIHVGDVLATLVVPQPIPGEWVIRKSHADARVRILSQQFFPRGLLVEPSAEEPPQQHDSIALAYHVLDSSGRLIEELRGYTFALDLTLTKPDGVSAVMAMQRPSAGTAIFRSTSKAQCDLPGRYWTDVRISVIGGDGRRFDVFRDRWSGFSVAPAAAIDRRSSASENARRSAVRRTRIRWIAVALLVCAGTAVILRRRKTKG